MEQLQDDEAKPPPLFGDDETIAAELRRAFAPPKAFPVAPQDHRRRICVIGGGIGGLAAALELERANHDVTLLEASSRFGGRVLTHRFSAKSYGEFGAMRIPPEHECVMQYVKEFGITQEPFAQSDFRSLYRLAGESRIRAQFHELPIAKRLGGIPHWPNPDRVLEEEFGNLAFAGRSLEERLSLVQYLLKPGDMRPPLRQFDAATLWQALTRTPHMPPTRSLSARRSRFSQPEWEVLGRATRMIWDEGASYLDTLLDFIAFYLSPKFQLKGGMSTLIDGLVGKSTHLGARLLPDCRVTRVDLTGSPGACVRWVDGDGKYQDEEFAFVLCTVPPARALQIEFAMEDKIALSRWRYAWSNVSYQSASKSLVYCRSRPWELGPHPITGGVTTTDLPIQECWYPSVDRDPDHSTMHSVTARRAAIEEDVVGRRRSSDFFDFDVPNKARPKREGVLTLYMRGANSLRFASMSPDERTSTVMECLERIHPGVSAVVKDVKHKVWDEDESPGGGAWAFFAPGQFQRYEKVLRDPMRNAAGRKTVYFAGEHLGRPHAWMQSAIQTALVAAEKMALDAVRRPL